MPPVLRRDSWYSRAWRHPAAVEGRAFAVLVAATTWACRPWAWDRDLVFGQWDALFSLVVLDRLQDALLGRGDWREAPLAWPVPHGSTQADWMLGQAVLGLPLRLVDVDALGQHPLLVFLGLLLTAWAFHRVASALLGPGPHTWVAGIVAGLNPMQGVHAQHLNLVFHGWMGLGALLLGAGLARARRGMAFAGALVLVLGGHFGLYLLGHQVLVGVVVAAGAFLAGFRDRRAWAAVAVGGGLGLLTFVAPARMYLDVAGRYDAWVDADTLVRESWDLARTLALVRFAPLHEGLAALRGVEIPPGTLDPANPGYLALGLAGIGALALRRVGRERWTWGVVGVTLVLALLLALGPDPTWNGRFLGVGGPYRLLALLPGASGLRAPARWLEVAFAALALLSAAGARVLLGTGRLRVSVVAGLLLAGIAAEIPRSEAQSRHLLDLPEIYQDLAGRPPGPVFDALMEQTATCTCTQGHRLVSTLVTGRPLAGGRGYARSLEALQTFHVQGTTWPRDPAVSLFRMTGVRYLLQHPPFAGDPPPDATCDLVDGHRLCLLPAPTVDRVPGPGEISPEGGGPVVGLRWERRIPVDGVTLTLQDGSFLQVPRSSAAVLDEVLGGTPGEAFVVLFPPQDEAPWSTIPGGIALRRVGGPASTGAAVR